MLFILVSLILLLCLVHCALNCNSKALLARRIPGPEGTYLIGNALDFIGTPAQLFRIARECTRTYGGIYRYWVFPTAVVNISTPTDIEKILSSPKFNEKSKIYLLVRPWLRNGLLVSRGAKWQQRRKILTPTFHFNILRQFIQIFDENSKRFVEKLKEVADQPIDALHHVSEYTLNSICETAMGTYLDEEKSSSGRSYKQSIYELGQILATRLVRVYLYPNFIFNRTNMGKEHDRHLQMIHGFTSGVIKARKEYVEEHGMQNVDNIENDNEDKNLFEVHRKNKVAMLDLLILAEKHGLINKSGIQEEIDTFMFEGHDTTASGLTFCLLCLANYKDVQDKVFSEVQQIMVDSTEAATMQDLAQMKYLECVIKEALRLYPPVPFISRQINESVELSGYKILKGTICNLLIFDLHRTESLYKSASEFQPERFLPENCVGRHPYAYIPFSAGPRNCIGQRFALLEMKSLLAKLVRQYEILPVTKPSELQFTADVVLRTTKPIYVKLAKRSL